MILYRFAKNIYSRDISGAGSKKWGGRWNSPGLPVVYASFTISLSLLELLVYHSSYKEIRVNRLMEIKTSDLSIHSVSAGSLKSNWQKDIDYCRFIGNEFLLHKKFLLLKVPSAIIPGEYNVMINPAHSTFNKVAILSAKIFEFDARLLK